MGGRKGDWHQMIEAVSLVDGDKRVVPGVRHMKWEAWPRMGASQVALVVKNPPASSGDVRAMGSIPGSGRSPGEGHGNPLQYSCLENPMDRGAWRDTAHRVTKSWTWLKWLRMMTERSLHHFGWLPAVHGIKSLLPTVDHKALLTNLLSAIHTEAFLHFSLYPACSHLWLVFTLAPLSFSCSRVGNLYIFPLI